MHPVRSRCCSLDISGPQPPSRASGVWCRVEMHRRVAIVPGTNITAAASSASLGATLAAVFFLGSCEGRLTRDVQATILELESTGLSVDSANGRTRAPRQHPGWKSGEALHHGVSTAAVSLAPGALVYVEPKTEIVLDRLSVTKDGNATTEAMHRSIHLQLLTGVAFFVVQFESESSDFIIRTPHGSLSPTLPGAFRLEVGQSKTRLTVLRGDFSFTPTSGTPVAQIQAGCFQEWPVPGGAANPAELDPRAQDEIEKSLAMEQKLLDLQNRQRVGVFPWREL